MEDVFVRLNLVSGSFLTVTIPRSSLDELVKFIGQGKGAYTFYEDDKSTTVNVQCVETMVY